ncbi:MAG: DUF502 domain-containing protein [Candidatus Hydrothermarchaeota archaeon]|nr:DUF502 domain-containing protein [Candidatus Hydrothermarchaeota archaeon]
MIAKLRNYFLTGLVIFVPVVVTIYIVWVAFNFLDGLLKPFVKVVLGKYVPGLSLLITILFILLIGAFATIAIGRKLVGVFEKTLLRIPIVRGIYLIIKQASAAFLVPQGTDFKRVVLVEFPRKGTYSLGFTTGVTVGEIQEKTVGKVINVFVPTSPNPTSGYFIMVPEESITPLDMSVQDALRFVISGGFSK